MGKRMFIQNRFMKFILFFFIGLGACKGNLESRHYPSGFKIPLPEKDFDSYKNKIRIQTKREYLLPTHTQAKFKHLQQI